MSFKDKGINVYAKSSLFYIIGNGLGLGLMMLSSIVFTRIMSKEGYGLYSTYYSFVSFLAPLVGLNLSNSLNNAYIDFRDKAREYRASILFFSTLAVLCLVILSVIINLIWCVFSTELVVLAFVHAFAFFVVSYYNNSATMENKYVKKTILLIVPNVLQIGFSIIFILRLPLSSFNARVIGSTLGVSVCAAIVYITMIKGYKKLISKDYWKYGLQISIPLIFSTISSNILTQSDNIMITAFRGAEETAVYSLVYYTGFIISGGLQATGPVLQAWLYRSLDSKDFSRIKMVQKWYMYFYAMLAIGLLMVSPEIIKILGPKSYWNFSYIGIFILSSYISVMYGFFSFNISFHKKNVYIAISVFLAAVINIALNSIFIPIYGGVAAAVATAVSYSILFFALGIFSHKLLKDLFSQQTYIIMFVFIMLATVVFEIICSFTLLRYIVFGVLLLLLCMYAFINRKEVLEIFK